MKHEKKCPVCQNNTFRELINFGLIPVSGVYLEDQDKKFCSTINSFEYCTKCALIRSDIEKQREYVGAKRSTRGQMPAYVSEIVSSLINYQSSREDLVVDVGGNDGAFLDLVGDLGYTKRLNIEPSVTLAKSSYEAGHMVENVYMNVDEAKRIRKKYGSAKVIFCRHVLEHVNDPVELMSAIRSLISEDGLLFVEAPDARNTLDQLLGHEFWDEHLFHFTSYNLSQLLTRSGFQPLRNVTSPHRGGGNIMFWAKAIKDYKHFHPSTEIVNADLERCDNFRTRWEKMKALLQVEATAWPRPIACLGASHPQTNYLIFTGIGAIVDCLVDDDPEKIGRYVPVPKPVPIVSSDMLLKMQMPGTIVRTAFGCDTWMEKICSSMKDVNIVDPYLTAENPSIID